MISQLQTSTLLSGSTTAEIRLSFFLFSERRQMRKWLFVHFCYNNKTNGRRTKYIDIYAWKCHNETLYLTCQLKKLKQSWAVVSDAFNPSTQ